MSSYDRVVKASPVDRNKPYGFIQWKGTKVCMDVHCLCGAHCHIDDDFCYSIQCGRCGQVYDVDFSVQLFAVPTGEEAHACDPRAAGDTDIRKDG